MITGGVFAFGGHGDWLSHLNNVAWQKDPELKRKVKGTNDTPGFAELEDGCGLYQYLRERGSATQPHVQSEMETEWAGVYAEAHARTQTKSIFSDVSTSDAILRQMTVLLETYESIAAHKEAPHMYPRYTVA